MGTVSDSLSPELSSAPAAQVLAQGRVWLQAALWALPALVAVPSAAALMQGHTEGLAQQLLYLLATGVLMYNVWRGSVWSWRLTVALSMLTGTLVFMAGLFAGRTLAQGLLISFAGLAFLGLGLLLVAAGPVRSYLDSLWAARAAHLQARRSTP